jgi:hypothetical protein
VGAYGKSSPHRRDRELAQVDRSSTGSGGELEAHGH